MNDWADTLAFGDRPTLTRGEVVGRYFVERFYRRSQEVGAQHVARQLRKWGIPLHIALLMLCAPACAVELNFMPPVQTRGEVFTFSGALSWDDGARILTVRGPWESFLEAVQPQHADFAVLGYVPLYEGDDWSVDYTGSTVTLTAPLEVRANPYYSDLVARIKPAVNKIAYISPAPEPSVFWLMAAGLLLVRRRK